MIAVPTNMLAEIPENVSFAQAATLPIAGLTALWTLACGGLLLNRRVLVTGASGGVGHFACQLAQLSGAQVVGVVRQADHEADASAIGVSQILVSEDLSEARSFGPYDLILESVGGRSLANALSMLAPGGTCVNFGTSRESLTTFDARHFYFTGGNSLYGFNIFYELSHKPVAQDLARLAQLVARGQLRPQIAVETSWTQISEMAQQLLERRFSGKAVLYIAN